MAGGTRGSRFVNVAVGVVLGTALGFAAAVAFLSVASPPGDAGPHATDAPPDADPPDDEPAPASDRAARHVGRAATDPFAEIAAGLPPVRTVPGDGFFDGTVVDRLGAPVAGVLVRAEPDWDDDAQLDPDARDDDAVLSPDEEMRGELRAVIARYRYRVSRLRQATTDAAGRFRIEGVAPGKYYVRPKLAGWEIEPVARDWNAREPGATTHWIARRRLGVDIDVEGVPGGETVRIAWMAADGNWWNSTNWGPAARHVELQAGAWRLRAVAGEFEQWVSPPADVTISEDSPTPRLSLTLREARGFVGRIVGGPATPPVPVRIGLAKFRDGVAPPTAEALTGEQCAWVNVGSPFGMMDLTPGRWAVVVTAPGRRVLADDVIDLADGLVKREYRVPDGDLGAGIVVRALAPDGRPLRDVRFTSGLVTTDLQRTCGDVPAIPRADGSWFVPLWERGFPAGSWSSSGGEGEVGAKDDGTPATVKRRWVQAESTEFGTAVADVAGDSREITLRFAPAATVEIEFDGPPPREVWDRLAVEVALPGDASRRWRHEAPAEHAGVFDGPDGGGDASAPPPIRLGPVPAGEVEVRVGVHAGWDAVWLPGSRRTLVAGVNRIRLAPPPLSDLRVTAEAGVLKNVTLRHESGETIGHSDDDAEELSVRWRGLPPGRYTLESWDVGEMTVILPGPSEVRFAPKPYNAFRVETDEDAPPLPGGLRGGDLIVAVNGRALLGRTQMSNALAAAALEPKVKFTVARGASQFDVEVESRVIEEGALSLEPTAR